MEKRLTHQHLRNKFKSQFELVNYAIRCAENLVKRTGELYDDNPSLLVIDALDEGEERIAELTRERSEESEQTGEGFAVEETSVAS